MKPALAALALVLLLPLSAAAADQAPGNATVLMDEVVVSATRTEKKVDDAPASVTVVTREEMRRHNIATIDDALRYEAGLYRRRTKGVADSIASVTMRGLPGDDRTLVMLDGVQLNDGYSGNVPWNELSSDNVERIEVIRGPGSALYGGKAMGGVINIITRVPDKTEGMVRSGVTFLEGDSDPNIFTYAMSAGTRQDRLSLRAGWEAADSEGYATDLVKKSTSSGSGKANSGYGMQDRGTGNPHWIVGDKGDNRSYKDNLDLMARYELTDTAALRLDYARLHNQYWYADPQTYLDDGSYRGNAQAHGGARTSTIRPRDFAGGRGKTDTDKLIATFTDNFDKTDVTVKGSYSMRQNWYTSVSTAVDKELDNQPGSLTESDTTTYAAEVQATRPLPWDNTLTVGLHYSLDDVRRTVNLLSWYQDRESNNGESDLTKGRSRLTAAFLEDEWKAAEMLTIYAGARLDYWESLDGVSGIGNRQVKHEDASDWGLSPRLAAVLNPLDDTYVRASVSRGFRSPNIYELFNTWTSSSGTTYASNPKLKPETVWTYELGGDQYLLERRVKLSATAFHSEMEDMIDSVTNGNTRTKENVGKVEVNGLELGAEVRPADWLRTWGAWTINRAKYKEHEANPLAEGDYVAGVPLEIINLGGEASWKWFTLSLAGNYLGRTYYDETNDDIEGVYTGNSKRWLWDLKLICKPMENLELSAGVENLLDETYYQYYLAPPRSYTFEIKWLF
ncbi:MAG: TonB-dependent receptor [Thermodesulfobacteriota bacterium]